MLLYILRDHRSELPSYDVLKSLKITMISAKCVDTDEMQHYAAFRQCLHCLLKYLYRGFQKTKG